MKILLINWRDIRNPEAGGAEIYNHEIFRRVAAQGNPVTLVSHRFAGAPVEEMTDGIRTLRVGNRYLFHVQFRRFYQRWPERNAFDLVVDGISKIPLYTRRYVSGPLAAILYHFHGKTLFTELAWPLALYIYRREKRIPRFYADTPIFAISPTTRADLIRHGHPEEKTELLFSGIDHGLFARARPEKSPTPLLAYVGRIKKYKNLETIVNALPRVIGQFPDVRLVIGGQGDHEDKIRRYVRSKGMEPHVQFLGFVPEETKPDVMGKAWLFVTMPEKEGWGITVIEANAAGTPVVGSDVEGLRDSIVNNKTGLLVPQGDPNALAEALVSLLGDRPRIEKMSQEARAWAAKFNWDTSAKHFLDSVGRWYPQLKAGC